MGDVVRGAFPVAADRVARVDPGELGATVAVSSVPPPHDLELEAVVLSDVLLDSTPHKDGTPTAFERVRALLRPEVFFGIEHGRVWQAIEGVALEGAPIDAATVGAWLNRKEWLGKVGGVGFLAKLCDVTPAPANVEAHAAALLEHYEDRALIEEANRVRIEGYVRRTGEERRTWRRDVRAALSRTLAERTQLRGAHIGVAVDESRVRINAANGGKVLGVPWCVPSLTAAFGLHVRGRQTVIGGLSEHGKTSFMAQEAIWTAMAPLDDLGVGEAVYVLSGEMPRAMFVFRAACSAAGIDATTVELGIATPDELAILGTWHDRIAALPIIVDDEPGPVEQMAARIREHKRLFETGRARRSDGVLLPKCRLQRVMVDHAQKWAAQFSGCHPRADTKEKIRTVSHAFLTHVTKALDVSTAVLAQVRRDAIDPKKGLWPRAAHLEGASELAQDADTIAIVHRPELMHDDDPPAKWVDVAGIVGAKRRFGGKKGVVKLRFYRGAFTEDLPAAARGEAYHEGD